MKTRHGADCGSDQQLLIAKFRCNLKKVGKTTRLFRCDLNQILYDYIVAVTSRVKELNLIPYGYTVEVTKTFKRLDLLDRLPEE